MTMETTRVGGPPVGQVAVVVAAVGGRGQHRAMIRANAVGIVEVTTARKRRRGKTRRKRMRVGRETTARLVGGNGALLLVVVVVLVVVQRTAINGEKQGAVMVAKIRGDGIQKPSEIAVAAAVGATL